MPAAPIDPEERRAALARWRGEVDATKAAAGDEAQITASSRRRTRQ